MSSPPASPELTAPRTRIRLGELLIELGFATGEQVEQGLVDQRRSGKRLGKTLIEAGVLTESRLVRALSEQLQVPTCDPVGTPIEPEILQLIDRGLAQDLRTLPFARTRDAHGEILLVATPEPDNVTARATIENEVGMRVQFLLCGDNEIELAFARHFGGSRFVTGVPAEPPPDLMRTRAVTGQPLTPPRVPSQQPWVRGSDGLRGVGPQPPELVEAVLLTEEYAPIESAVLLTEEYSSLTPSESAAVYRAVVPEGPRSVPAPAPSGRASVPPPERWSSVPPPRAPERWSSAPPEQAQSFAPPPRVSVPPPAGDPRRELRPASLPPVGFAPRPSEPAGPRQAGGGPLPEPVRASLAPPPLPPPPRPVSALQAINSGARIDPPEAFDGETSLPLDIDVQDPIEAPMNSLSTDLGTTRTLVDDQTSDLLQKLSAGFEAPTRVSYASPAAAVRSYGSLVGQSPPFPPPPETSALDEIEVEEAPVEPPLVGELDQLVLDTREALRNFVETGEVDGDTTLWLFRVAAAALLNEGHLSDERLKRAIERIVRDNRRPS